MFKSRHSQFFRTTTGIQSRPDAFDESRMGMTFLTNLGITETLCSFRVVLGRKVCKKIPEWSRLELSEKFLTKNFALSDAEDDNSESLNNRGIADLSLLRAPYAIYQNSWKPSFWEVINSFVLLACVSLTASRTLLLQLLLGCQNFTLDLEDLFWWYIQKSDFYEIWQQHGDGHEWGLTWHLWWVIHTTIPTSNHSENSLAAAKVLGLKIFSHGTSLKWSQKRYQ